jgi:hypothetical protein
MTNIKFTKLVFCSPLAVLFFIAATNVSAADDDLGLWATGTYVHDISDRWFADIAIQSRFNQDLEKLERLLFRPSLTYNLDTGPSLTLGYDLHSVESPRDKIEHRTWQQISVSKRLPRITAFAWTRLEQRYIEDVSGAAVRLRLRAGASMPLQRGYSVVLANEVFFGLNELTSGPRDGFDQNRLYIGLAKRLSEHIVGQLGYQMQYIDKADTDSAGHQIFISLSYR